LTTKPPKRGLNAVAIAGIVVAVLVVLGLGAVAFFAVTRAVSSPVVGDCLHITKQSPGGGAFEKRSCRDTRAAFLVELRKERSSSCPSEDYTRLDFTDGGTRVTLCLTLNVSAGDCLTGIEDDTRIAKVMCHSSQAQVRVDVHTGDGMDACAGLGGTGFLYEGPPVRTVCLTTVGESI
jgi:hypothetical protein